MKKIMDMLKNKLKINKKLFIFLLVLVIIGIASGAILSLNLNIEDQKLVKNYLNNFFNNINNLDTKNTLINTLITTLGFSILIYLLGFSVVGLVIVLFMLFGKAFILGFSVSSIISIYKIKGIIYALIYIFPHHIINIFLFIILSGISLIISFKIINGLLKDKKIELPNMNKYNYTLLITLFIEILMVLYEIYLMPIVMNIIISFLK
jgi:stage II sporulation protein M